MNFVHSCFWQLYLNNKRWDEISSAFERVHVNLPYRIVSISNNRTVWPVFDRCEFVTPRAWLTWVTWRSTPARRHNAGVRGREGMTGGYKLRAAWWLVFKPKKPGQSSENRCGIYSAPRRLYSWWEGPHCFRAPSPKHRRGRGYWHPWVLACILSGACG